MKVWSFGLRTQMQALANLECTTLLFEGTFWTGSPSLHEEDGDRASGPFVPVGEDEARAVASNARLLAHARRASELLLGIHDCSAPSPQNSKKATILAICARDGLAAPPEPGVTEQTKPSTLGSLGIQGCLVPSPSVSRVGATATSPRLEFGLQCLPS